MSAFTADDLDLFPAAPGYAERCFAVRTFKEFVFFPLCPLLFLESEPGEYFHLLPDILIVLIGTFIKVSWKHANINENTQDQNKRITGPPDRSGKNSSQQKKNNITEKQKSIQIIVSVSAGHKSCYLLFHSLTWNHKNKKNLCMLWFYHIQQTEFITKL